MVLRKHLEHNPLMSKADINQLIREIEVIELVGEMGEKYVVWMN